jgi:hypothetical protein
MTETGDEGLEQVFRRLSEVQRRLMELSPGPSPERFTLLTEQDALRRHAAEFERSSLADRSDGDLRAELKALVGRLDHAVASRTGFATSKGGNNSGPTGGAWVGLGRAAIDGADLDWITARISAIEDEILRRDITPQP